MLPQRIDKDIDVVFREKRLKIDNAVTASQALQKYSNDDNAKQLLTESDKALNEIKKIISGLEEIRKEIVKPVNDEVNVINAWFKAIKDEFSKSFEKISNNILIYKKLEKAEQDRINAAERERLEMLRIEAAKTIKAAESVAEPEKKPCLEQLKKAENIMSLSVPKVIIEQQTKSKIKKEYSAEVIDKEAFIKYCLNSNMLFLLDINQKQLNKIAATAEGKISIDGAKVVETEVLKSRMQR